MIIKEVSMKLGNLKASIKSLAPKRMITLSKVQDKIRIESVELVYLTIPECNLNTEKEITVANKHNKNALAKSLGFSVMFLVSL